MSRIPFITGAFQAFGNTGDAFRISSSDRSTAAQVIDPQRTAPNEIQGSGIKGGTRIAVKAGDVIHIPTGIPHQFFLAPGKQITYMLVKVVDPPNQNC